MKTVLFAGACLSLLMVAGCKDSNPQPKADAVQVQPKKVYKEGGRTINTKLAAGPIKLLVPWEGSTSHNDLTGGGVMYMSDTIRLTISAEGKLLLNTTNYGTVKTGDVVNLLNKGRLFVNDEERTNSPDSK